MKFLTYIQKIFFVSLLIASINTQSASAWILVFNGTSSSGKTTLAKNFQKIAQEKSEILQYDIEADLLLKETLENLGYKYDTKLSIREWFESLPKEVQKKIDDVDDDVAWTSIQKRIVEKAQKFNQKGINVIIDTGLKSKDDYNLFVNGLSTKNTYFVLVYAPISQLLKNLEARNNSGNKGEERNPLGPFFQYFWFLSKKCDTKSCEKLDVLTKKDFEKVFERLEVLIKKNDKFDDYWVSASDFQKIKDIIDHEFFHTCWEYSPDSMKNSMPWRWLKTWLPCYCGGQDVTGVALKLPIKHDFVINTATTNPTDCAIVLNNWFAERMLKK